MSHFTSIISTGLIKQLDTTHREVANARDYKPISIYVMI